MTRTYRFNRPVSLLFLLPMVLLLVMLTAGLLREFNVLAFLLVLLSLSITAWVVYFSLLRSMTVGPQGLRWKAPGKEWEMEWEAVRHFGVVKYRSFRFIYLSRSEAPPFQEANARIVSSEETFVIELRRRAWQQVRELMKARRPELKPVNMERGQ